MRRRDKRFVQSQRSREFGISGGAGMQNFAQQVTKVADVGAVLPNVAALNVDRPLDS
jgi:hypothetical protein